MYRVEHQSTVERFPAQKKYDMSNTSREFFLLKLFLQNIGK